MFDFIAFAEKFLQFENFTPGWDLSMTILSVAAASLAVLCEMDKRCGLARRTLVRAVMGRRAARRQHLARAATMRPVRGRL